MIRLGAYEPKSITGKENRIKLGCLNCILKRLEEILCVLTNKVTATTSSLLLAKEWYYC
jgi:hypothetical protein